MHIAPRSLLWLLMLCVSLAAQATPVNVTFKSTSGAPVTDAVAVLDALEGVTAGGATGALIDQVNRQFTPRVSVIRTGTAVSFPNSDRIRHQVYSFSPAKTFNLKLYAGATQPPVIFDRPGLVVLGCNIHDSMIAFVAVVATPWFGKSGADGVARIEAPPGRYKLRLWHPDLAAPLATQVVTVGTTPTAFTPVMNIAAVPTTVAAWPE